MIELEAIGQTGQAAYIRESLETHQKYMVPENEARDLYDRKSPAEITSDSSERLRQLNEVAVNKYEEFAGKGGLMNIYG